MPLRKGGDEQQPLMLGPVDAVPEHTLVGSGPEPELSGREPGHLIDQPAPGPFQMRYQMLPFHLGEGRSLGLGGFSPWPGWWPPRAHATSLSVPQSGVQTITLLFATAGPQISENYEKQVFKKSKPII
jgi:hypothetical protein